MRIILNFSMKTRPDKRSVCGGVFVVLVCGIRGNTVHELCDVLKKDAGCRLFESFVLILPSLLSNLAQGHCYNPDILTYVNDELLLDCEGELKLRKVAIATTRSFFDRSILNYIVHSLHYPASVAVDRSGGRASGRSVIVKKRSSQCRDVDNSERDIWRIFATEAPQEALGARPDWIKGHREAAGIQQGLSDHNELLSGPRRHEWALASRLSKPVQFKRAWVFAIRYLDSLLSSFKVAKSPINEAQVMDIPHFRENARSPTHSTPFPASIFCLLPPISIGLSLGINHGAPSISHEYSSLRFCVLFAPELIAITIVECPFRLSPLVLRSQRSLNTTISSRGAVGSFVVLPSVTPRKVSDAYSDVRWRRSEAREDSRDTVLANVASLPIRIVSFYCFGTCILGRWTLESFQKCAHAHALRLHHTLAHKADSLLRSVKCILGAGVDILLVHRPPLCRTMHVKSRLLGPLRFEMVHVCRQPKPLNKHRTKASSCEAEGTRHALRLLKHLLGRVLDDLSKFREPVGLCTLRTEPPHGRTALGRRKPLLSPNNALCSSGVAGFVNLPCCRQLQMPYVRCRRAKGLFSGARSWLGVGTITQESARYQNLPCIVGQESLNYYQSVACGDTGYTATRVDNLDFLLIAFSSALGMECSVVRSVEEKNPSTSNISNVINRVSSARKMFRKIIGPRQYVRKGNFARRNMTFKFTFHRTRGRRFDDAMRRRACETDQKVTQTWWTKIESTTMNEMELMELTSFGEMKEIGRVRQHLSLCLVAMSKEAKSICWPTSTGARIAKSLKFNTNCNWRRDNALRLWLIPAFQLSTSSIRDCVTLCTMHTAHITLLTYPDPAQIRLRIPEYARIRSNFRGARCQKQTERLT
ncbi:uncharacterized protein BDR25DRAFT_356587 [Lindgomyces ingoldianus]|uniref:Uncharacterized protein n=1 Tax=Lindgomyces ingoldianus TaxID=673940 RepID=A0ACB6QTD0_9PLEO|nr:uncharacterized protein BDR25DRAFT_356587 [Lindgomyces ingoldianus]KAF2469355.1 hypothetical protein BDR25DRAFT_356587 [Lindgomyces ingoldianus]